MNRINALFFHCFKKTFAYSHGMTRPTSHMQICIYARIAHMQIRLGAIGTLRQLSGFYTFVEEHVEVILSMLDVRPGL